MREKRKAESKIRSAEDLDGICTLGFRGEALAAISAVSNLRIISKVRNSPMGAELTVSCGEIVDLAERGCSDGTTIIVEDLFANVPARRKFLKRDVTETTAVCTSVEKVALSHPEIAFKLITDGQIKLETAGDGKLMSAIYAVFGRDFASKLIKVDGEYDGITVSGYIGRSDNVKSNRNYESFFINKRFIKSRTASAAIEQAFVSYMPSEKFPVCVLFLTLNPSRVDVNVHPAKLEVKFSNEKPVFEAVYYAVKQALENNTTRPQISPQSPTKMTQAFAPVEREASLKARQISIELSLSDKQTQSYTAINSAIQGKPLTEKSHVSADEYRALVGIPQRVDHVNAKPEQKKADNSASKHEYTTPLMTADEYIREHMCRDDEQRAQYDALMKKHLDDLNAQKQAQCEINKNENSVVIKQPERIETDPSPESVSSKPYYRIVGEVFNSYVLVETSEKMLIIDKHAAHERIIFEQLKKNLYSNDTASQMLMLPIEVMLMSDEVAAIEEYRAELEAVGFEFSSSRNTICVNAIPLGIDQDAVTDMFMTVADRIKNGTGNVEVTKNIIFEKALYQASCKAAIKAGREYPPEYQKWVVDKLMELPDITFCPHGRPVAMEMTKKYIDRQFERT